MLPPAQVLRYLGFRSVAEFLLFIAAQHTADDKRMEFMQLIHGGAERGGIPELAHWAGTTRVDAKGLLVRKAADPNVQAGVVPQVGPGCSLLMCVVLMYQMAMPVELYMAYCREQPAMM
jgi:hypothetical protein